ncbi:Yip1 member 1 [Mactra antiquata]
MSTTVDLDFHDSGGDDVLFDKTKSQTHTFHNFPDSAVDDDYEDGGDKSQLLKEDEVKKSPSFWTFEYYQQFFDVETRQVFHRVTGSMLPMPNRNYLQASIRPNPDLYGPFWICTTLVFTTAIAGNLANYLSSGGKNYHWRYDFHKVTFAAAAIFSYWWLIPGIMYGFLWWRKSQAGYTFLEILCVYGYSLAIYIPISILWVINITWFKWTLVIIGAVMSGGVLVITFWPAVKEDTKNIAFVFIGLIFLFHLSLAAGFVLYFFYVPTMASTTVPTTLATTAKPPQAPEKVPVDHHRLKTEATKVDSNSKPHKTVNNDGNDNNNMDDKVKTTSDDKDNAKVDDAPLDDKNKDVTKTGDLESKKGDSNVGKEEVDNANDKVKRKAVRNKRERQKA